jgi:hypothetical protein
MTRPQARPYQALLKLEAPRGTAVDIVACVGWGRANGNFQFESRLQLPSESRLSQKGRIAPLPESPREEPVSRDCLHSVRARTAQSVLPIFSCELCISTPTGQQQLAQTGDAEGINRRSAGACALPSLFDERGLLPATPALDRSGRQLVEERLRLFQIARVKPLSEPPVNRSEQFASLLHLALIAPQLREARRGS